MLTVFLSFAAGDQSVAEAIAARLRQTAEVHVIPDEIPDHTLATAWEAGTGSTGIILLLSPASVPPRISREEWADLLRHIETRSEPPVLSVLVRPCAYPRLLERNRFIRWDENGAALRDLQLWAVALHPPDPGGFVPALQPCFAGRNTELEWLLKRLADCPGTAVITGAPRSGKTSLAQEFARQAQGFFKKVVWVSCRGRSRDCVVADLAAQLGVPFKEAAENAVLRIFEQHRILAVFDELEWDDLAHPGDRGAASTLITRSAPLPDIPVLRLEAAGFPEPGRPSSAEGQLLLEAMTVCRADQVSLELACALAQLPIADTAGICRDLVTARLIDPLDQASGTYRLSRPADVRQREAELRRQHARLMLRRLSLHIPEARAALKWACAAAWDLAVPLGRNLVSHLMAEGRAEEGACVLAELNAAAERRGDFATVAYVRHELSWIAGSPNVNAGAAGTQQLQFEFAL